MKTKYLSNIAEVLCHQEHGPPLKDYLLQKNQWTEEEFSTIDWNAFNKACSDKPRRQQTQVCKMIHGWQNVGTQKHRINNQTAEHQCPFGCNQIETQHHYLYCPDPTAQTTRFSLLHSSSTY